MNEAPAAPRQPPGKRIAFALAVLMHVLLAALLVYGIHWQTQPPETVAVELVSAVPPAPTSAPEPKPEPPKPEPKPEPPKPQPKPEPPKPAPKPDIVQKEKPKPEPKKPEPPKPDAFKEEMEREMHDRERQRQVDKELAALNAIKAKQASAAQAGEIDKYIAAIRGKVHSNIVLPPDLKGNPEAVFDVIQLPSGDVMSVKLKKSSGNPAWDTATERAIHKSSPLPKPGKPELFRRELELKFRPQED
jgi:colicin import membrane protein